MGVLIKFIIIFLVVSYLIRKVGGYFLKVLFGSNTSTGQQSYGNYRSSQTNDYNRSSETGRVYVTKRPKHSDKEPHVTGGEYVDFEEVKD